MSDLKTNLQEILQEKQDKIIPENIKKDVQIFDVTGTYDGGGSSTTGVKLFKTEEEMQADSTAKEGDLAVVYGTITANSNYGDKNITQIVFPNIVTLPEQVTSNYTFSSVSIFSGFTLTLTSTSFSYSSRGFNKLEVTYTSVDGITYNRTTEIENPVEVRSFSISR